MKNKQKLPSIVTLVILTAVTSVVWVFVSIYRVFVSSPTPNVPAKIIEPISPTLDQTALNKLEKRVYLDESQIPEMQISSMISQIPIPSPTPQASSSATPAP